MDTPNGHRISTAFAKRGGLDPTLLSLADRHISRHPGTIGAQIEYTTDLRFTQLIVRISDFRRRKRELTLNRTARRSVLPLADHRATKIRKSFSHHCGESRLFQQ